MQPEIKFIKKLINMRKAAERLHSNRKPNVMAVSEWLERHIKANRYDKPNEARSFLIRHSEKVEYLIPSGKPRLMEEFISLSSLSKTLN